jgi:hypothetical protein
MNPEEFKTPFNGSSIGKLMPHSQALLTIVLDWHAIIGPHWRYGKREDNNGQDLRPLFDWHYSTTHDQVSFNDLRVFADLVPALCIFQGFQLRTQSLMLIHRRFGMLIRVVQSSHLLGSFKVATYWLLIMLLILPLI